MASGRTDNVIIPTKIDLVTESATTIEWKLRRNPTVSGFTWAASNNGRGNVEVTSSGTIVSGGTIVNSGLFSSAGSLDVATPAGLAFSLGINPAKNCFSLLPALAMQKPRECWAGKSSFETIFAL
jgi:hypothetical protein